MKAKTENPIPQKQVAAFFDLNNTLLDGDSQDLEIRYFRRKGWVSAGFMIQVLADYLLYKADIRSSEKMIRTCLAVYRGRNPKEVEEEAFLFYSSRIRPRLVPRILSLLEEHRAKGHVPVLVSASVEHILRPLARDIDVPDFLCTRLERDSEGYLTGRPFGPICIGFEKRFLAERFAASRGIGLRDSFAYSDHHADIPFLSAVGHPVTVRPTTKLRAAARARGWPVIDF